MAGLQTSGTRRVPRGGPDTSGRETTTDRRRRTASARAGTAESKRAYEAGLVGDEGALTDDRQRGAYEDGEREAKRRSSEKRRGKAKAKATKKATRTGRAVVRDAKKLAPAAAGQVTSGLALVGMTLGLVGLYLVLTNVKTFEGLLGGAARAVQWLADPNTSIPYHQERA